MARGFSVFVNIGATVASSVDASAKAVERRMGSMGRAMKVQAAESKAMARSMASSYRDMTGIFVGAGAFAGLSKFVKAGGEYQHQLAMMKNSGRTVGEISQAVSHANATMAALPTATLTENLKVLNETTLAYGNFQHALDNLTFNQKMGGMLQNMLGEKAGDPGEMFNSLIRTMEMRMGANAGSAQARGELSKLYQAMVVSNGKVNPSEILGFAQTANPAMRGYNERFFTRIVPSLIQEFGGERAGTGLTAFNNQIMGRVGIGGKTLTDEWIRLGLVPRRGSGGNMSARGWTAGSMKGTSLAMSDPLAFAEQFLLPAMAKHGININDEKSVMLESKKLFGRETGARLAGTLMSPQQRSRLHKDEAMYSKALGPDAAYAQSLRNDPQMALAASAASLKNLETNIGKAITPEVTLGLVNFARGVNWLASAIDKHPMLGKLIGGLFAGIVGLTALKFGHMAFKFIGLGKGLRGFIGAFSAVGRLGPRIPLLMRIGNALSILGEPLVAGLATLGPMLMAGLTAAFEVLSGPIGWAMLATTAGLLAWRFRGEIAKAWHVVVDWFGGAFSWIKTKFMSMPWGALGKAIGWLIADTLTLGLADKLPNMIAAVRSRMGGHPAAANSNAPHRAAGGSVSRGNEYAVNEDGDEMFVPGRSGTMIPARATAALIAALSGGVPMAAAAAPNVSVGAIHVYEAHDARETARCVREEIMKIARGQSAYMND